jgi:hypothetical protein
VTSVDRTAYPRFPRVVSGRELAETFTPSDSEVDWARGRTQDAGHLLALVVWLKSYQRLGYFPKLAAIPDDAERPETWPVFEALLPHAQVALADDSDGIDQLAGYLGYRGSYASALELERRFRDALERSSLGPGHRRTLAARVHFAYWTGRAGDAATARDQDAALLPVCERVFGPEHPQTLAARTNLARWTGEAGDAAGARDQSVALLSVCERVFGPEHPQTLAVRIGLARWTGEAGDAAAARDQFVALLPVCGRALGPEHLWALGIRTEQARWTGRAGDAAGARDQGDRDSTGEF